MPCLCRSKLCRMVVLSDACAGCVPSWQPSANAIPAGSVLRALASLTGLSGPGAELVAKAFADPRCVIDCARPACPLREETESAVFAVASRPGRCVAEASRKASAAGRPGWDVCLCGMGGVFREVNHGV